MIHGRHVDQKASGQRYVAGDSRAFFADRLFGNLYQDLLAFFEQVGDLGKILRFVTAETSSPTASSTSAWSAATRAVTITVESWTRSTLSVSSSRGRGANFGAGIHSSIAYSLGSDEGLSFGLRLFQFRFFLGNFIHFFLSLRDLGGLR